MTDEIKLNQAVVRQAQAEALLRNELLREAFEILDSAYVTAWRTLPARDVDGRERLWQAVNVVSKVREHLNNVISNGKISQRELDALVQKRKLFSVR